MLTHVTHDEESGDRFREIQTVEEVESEDDGSSGGVPYWINSLLIHFRTNQLKAKPNLVFNMIANFGCGLDCWTLR